MATADAEDQCRALTNDGERCTRPAENGRFCYQHDENDPTVDGGSSDASTDGQEDDSSAEDPETDGESTSQDDSEQADEPGQVDTQAIDGDGGIMETRKTVRAIGQDIIGHEVDSIVGIARNDNDWQVTVEVVERSAVPDTQDILGQYEIDLDSDQTVVGYRRIDRYRRGDTQREDYIG